MTTPSRRPLVVLAVVLALAAAALAPLVSAAVHDATATRTPLAQARAAGALDHDLALTEVTVPPGVELAKHRHPGTQIATIVAGRLTYTVFTGTVKVFRTGADGAPALVGRITAGTTRVLRPGDTVVEQPGSVHMARNRGTAAVRIVLASLFPHDAAPAIPVS